MVNDAWNEGRLDPRTADPLDPRATGAGHVEVAAAIGVVEDGVLDIDDAEPCGQVAIADVAPDGGRGAAGAGAHHHPVGNGMGLALHLAEDAFGDVVVAPPVGRALGVGELVKVVPARLCRQPCGHLIDLRRVVDEMAAPAEAFDALDLGRAGAARHHRDEGQVQEFGEVSLGHGRRTGRGLDQRGARADAAVADAVEEQRPRQPMLQAAGRMRAFVLQIDRDAAQTAEGGLHQMRIGRAPSVALQQVDRLLRPVAVNPGGQWNQIGPVVGCGDRQSGVLLGAITTRSSWLGRKQDV